MYHHVKKLMYTVEIGEPDPKFGKIVGAIWWRERRTRCRHAVFNPRYQLRRCRP
jgi:hypothetical protein